MSLKVYIAARFSRRQELRAFAERLEDAGCEVTSRWVWSDDLNRDLATELAQRAAARDLEDLRRADVCVAFCELAGGAQGRGGRHVEFGAAAALGLQLVVVGDPEHVFHRLPGVVCVASPDDAIRQLAQPVAA